ncbi:AAA family ATPase [Nocardia ignorata]|uniref:AAA family ATPase n=1 Tax=Nocardia ignorata TaxID=145285 RepID=UPI00362BB00F
MAQTPLRTPTVVVISGRPGSGKTTLAHALADKIGVPAIIRDEIKQGMVLAGRGDPGVGYDDLNVATLHAFFGVITTLVQAGVSVVAEAAFQHKLWHPNLLPLAAIAEIRIVHAIAPTEVIHDRITHRADTNRHRQAHNDSALLDNINAGTHSLDDFVPVELDVPTLTVDTTNGYRPGLESIAQFVVEPLAGDACEHATGG